MADTFPEQTIETRKKLLSDIADTDTLFIGSHFYFPVAGKIVNSADGLIFKIEDKYEK